MELNKILAQMSETAKKAGQFFAAPHHITVTAKEGHANFVTSMDTATQALVIDELSRIIAVSYTHLDVYKRQAKMFPRSFSGTHIKKSTPQS